MGNHRPSNGLMYHSHTINRKRRLRDHSKLVEIQQRNPNSTNIFEENLVDTFYPERQDEMEDMCLYDFVANYVKCGIDKDGKTKYRKLNKSTLPNHKLFNPKKEDEKESYFYSLLLLFVPFRNEDELTEEGKSAEDAFNRHMEHNDALNIHCDKLQTMLRANENVQKINEVRQAEQQQVPVSEPVEGDEGPQVAGEATPAMHDVADLQHSDNYGPSLDELASSLNADQTRVFDNIKCQLQHLVQHETGTCKCSDLKPLHMFISGVGGTGKSFLIKVIRALVLVARQGRVTLVCCDCTHWTCSIQCRWCHHPPTAAAPY